jgi:hypothetical protein
VIAAITIASVIQKKSKIKPLFIFYTYLLSGLFFLATLYKDFFWKNYYEGIHYIFIFVVISLIGHGIHKRFIVAKRAILLSLLLGLIILNGVSVRGSFTNKIPFDGLQVHEAVVKHIIDNQDLNQEYCIRVYTPSVIPHTYNYLFLVHNMKPSSEWVNGTCWFIVEADSFAERKQAWLDTNQPKDKNTVMVKKIKDIEVRYYKVLQK